MEILRSSKASKLSIEDISFLDSSFLDDVFSEKFFSTINLMDQLGQDVISGDKLNFSEFFSYELNSFKSLKENSLVMVKSLQSNIPAIRNQALKLLDNHQCIFNCNLYFSHTKSIATGIGYHWDFKPLLIMQLEGVKTWKVRYLGKFVETFELKKGDILYIPSRLEHSVEGHVDTISGHLNFTFDEGSYFEFFSFIFNRMGSPKEFEIDDAHSKLQQIVNDQNFKNHFIQFEKTRKDKILDNGFTRD